MLKLITFIIAISITSTIVWSQTHTSGGGLGITMAENLAKKIGDENIAMSGSSNNKFIKISKKVQKEIKQKMQKIVEVAQANIKTCQKDSQTKYQNEMDIYYHLEFTHHLTQGNPFINDPNRDCEKCRLDAVEKLKLCLKQNQLPEMITEIINHDHLTRYLRSEYKLSNDHAILIIKSFTQLTSTQEAESGR